MSASLLLSHHSVIFLLLLVSVSLLPTYDCAEDDPSYRLCKQNFDCGLLPNLSYPFWGFRPGYLPIRSKLCGGGDRFELLCEPDSYPIIDHRLLLYVNQSSKVMGWIDKDVWNLMLCPWNYANLSVLKKPSPEENNRAPAGSVFLRLYSGCDRNKINVSNLIRLPCPIRDEEGSDAFYSDEELGHACTFRGGFLMAKENISPIDNYGHLEESACHLCEGSHGICGTNDSTDRFACLCRDGLHEFSCEVQGSASNTRSKLIIGVPCGVAIVIVCVILYSLREKLPLISSTIDDTTNANKSNQNIESFLRNHGALSSKRYSFSEVKKMTNSFKHRLGQGGYGSVYKGKVCNDCLVAVKVLNVSKGNGEEFINEVASIGRTSHVNIVNLLGFCVEGRKRILIYEFMPNGSLDKFIGSKTLVPDQHIGWENLYQIALGVARGLEYLHSWCNTRIVHLDIKPHNILLDEEFCPKISDFGLAKLVYKKESAVSLAEARGTIGYIAPEVFMEHLGRASYKSDVYSYGMMTLEMVGARNKVPEGVENSTDKYFPNWIYTQLEARDMSKTFGLMKVEEAEVVRKMTIVGLWCIQTNPSDRPSMNKVIEMLEGSTEALQMPVRPSWSSPRMLLSDSQTLSMN